MENFYKMRDWVHKTNRWDDTMTMSLSSNTSPGIVKFLREHPQHIYPKRLSSNSGAFELLVDRKEKKIAKFVELEKFIYNKHPDALPYILPGIITRQHRFSYYTSAISSNPNPAAIAVIRENLKTLNMVDWGEINKNPCPDAIQLLRENMEFANVFQLALNPAPEAVALIGEMYRKWVEYMDATVDNAEVLREIMGSELGKCVLRLDETDWEYVWNEMCRHPAGLDYLLKNRKPISLKHLSSNPSPDAIAILGENLFDADIDWYSISSNPGAIDLLEQVFMQLHDENGEYVSDQYRERTDNTPVIYWSILIKNPAIFTYDYDKMREERAQLHADLTEQLWSPARVAAFLEAGGDIEELDADELPPHKMRLETRVSAP